MIGTKDESLTGVVRHLWRYCFWIDIQNIRQPSDSWGIKVFQVQEQVQGLWDKNNKLHTTLSLSSISIPALPPNYRSHPPPKNTFLQVITLKTLACIDSHSTRGKYKRQWQNNCRGEGDWPLRLPSFLIHRHVHNYLCIVWRLLYFSISKETQRKKTPFCAFSSRV